MLRKQMVPRCPVKCKCPKNVPHWNSITPSVYRCVYSSQLVKSQPRDFLNLNSNLALLQTLAKSSLFELASTDRKKYGWVNGVTDIYQLLSNLQGNSALSNGLQSTDVVVLVVVFLNGISSLPMASLCISSLLCFSLGTLTHLLYAHA